MGSTELCNAEETYLGLLTVPCWVGPSFLFCVEGLFVASRTRAAIMSSRRTRTGLLRLGFGCSSSSSTSMAKSLSPVVSPRPNELDVPNGCETDSGSAEVEGTLIGTSWNARAGPLVLGGAALEVGTLPLMDEDGTVPGIEPAKVGWMRFLGLRFAMRVCTCSPPGAAFAAPPKSCD